MSMDPKDYPKIPKATKRALVQRIKDGAEVSTTSQGIFIGEKGEGRVQLTMHRKGVYFGITVNSISVCYRDCGEFDYLRHGAVLAAVRKPQGEPRRVTPRRVRRRSA
tara:strand:- start:2587 stop:2907 length:321 start_codon:yes stop_codon:yes gene_type:complete